MAAPTRTTTPGPARLRPRPRPTRTRTTAPGPSPPPQTISHQPAGLPHLLGGNQAFIDLATHARTHPETSLDRWRPASAFHDLGMFYRQGGNPQMMVHGPKGLHRPDGAGVWTERGRSVPFLLEYDTGRERLDILTEKVAKYERLHVMSTWAWPVLFHPPPPAARRTCRLADVGETAIIATTTADLRAATGTSPAEQIWQRSGRNFGRHRLVDLPYTDSNHDKEFPALAGQPPD